MRHRYDKMIRETFHTDSKIKQVLFNKKSEMKINYRLLEARFIDRPNRFLTRVELNGNQIGVSHMELLSYKSSNYLKSQFSPHSTGVL